MSPYVKQTWTDNQTPVDKAHLDHIEDGLVAADANATSALGRVQVPTVVNGQWLKGVGGAAVWSGITSNDVTFSQYSTTLPASPYDGQEAILVDAATPTYVWKFRYNAVSTSPYKWEFIGGSPLSIIPSDYTPPATGAYYVDSAGASTLFIPRAGDYNLETQAGLGSAANSGQYLGFSSADRVGTWVAGGAEGFIFYRKRYTLTAGQPITNTVFCTNAVSLFTRRIISALPIRVS